MAHDIDLERNTGLVSQGMHLFKVATAREGEKEGDPYWGFSCICQDAGDDQGREAFLYLPHTPQMRWKLNNFLDAMGAAQKGTAKSGQFVGKLFRAEVLHDDYTGEMRAALSNMLPYDGQPSLEGFENADTVEVATPVSDDDIPF